MILHAEAHAAQPVDFSAFLQPPAKLAAAEACWPEGTSHLLLYAAL